MSDRCVYRTSGPHFSAAQVIETHSGKFVVRFYRFNQWLACGEYFNDFECAARRANDMVQ